MTESFERQQLDLLWLTIKEGYSCASSMAVVLNLVHLG